ncbi:hypothetical protein C8Q78DRAFT_396584 [Trametes maxima]|nr:hypothetical protein C8Q78DRAFT_396584 [Trametes maxima]
MAQTTHRPCQARLANESTACKKKAQEESLYCANHGREYAKCTAEYKALSAQAERLNPGTLTAQEIRRLDSVSVNKATKMYERYCAALSKEKEVRTTHHLRFFGEFDPGHAQWLEHLSREHKKASAVLNKLRSRGEHARSWVGVPESAGAYGVQQQYWSSPPIDSGLDIDPVIAIPCILMLALLAWVMPLGVWSFLWDCMKSAGRSIMPYVVRVVWATIASLIRTMSFVAVSLEPIAWALLGGGTPLVSTLWSWLSLVVGSAEIFT